MLALAMDSSLSERLLDWFLEIDASSLGKGSDGKSEGDISSEVLSSDLG
eukprot:CAMPEP_0184313024 /NCGR_PEP_ID=MMETSP1049-20130417/58407_1 /TAXON_ID=77928 /ORGANISM="Proteomonas sulcata, Strain CCMP704" /LENGTH=48 /DNA_ID= /DNA_START= /DNA_END= /DNA_ORIENTATION=